MTLPAEFFPARADIFLPAGVVGPDPLTFDVQAFVVRRGDDVALVDTLMQADQLEIIHAALAMAHAEFTDIRYVVLTHHHPDHSGGLAEIARRASQAQILGGAGDLATISGSTGVSVDAVGAGESVLGLEVIETPGHTPGHICLFDPPSSTMLLGDVAGSSGGLIRTPARFTEDPTGYERTLLALAERQFDRAIPSHGPAITGQASLSLGALARQSP